jgi:hypothetical protein
MKAARSFVIVLAALAVLPLAAVALESSPPAIGTVPPGDQTEFVGGAVTAVVVRSWGSGSSALVWQHLNDNWALYGETQVVIDHTTLHEVESFTLADLEAVGADVVIVSDPAGGLRQWTGGEVDALRAYAEAGHSLVGTYLLYQWDVYDNRALAPLWGHRSDIAYSSAEADPSTAILAPEHCLFVDITDPLDLGGYPNVGLPADDLSWDDADLAGATIVARSSGGNNAVTSYDAGSYQAYYISYMPEYQEGSAFEATQWLYNAIVCTPPATPTTKVSWGTVKETFR